MPDSRTTQITSLIEDAQGIVSALDAELPDSFSLVRYDLRKLAAALNTATTVATRLGKSL